MGMCLVRTLHCCLPFMLFRAKERASKSVNEGDARLPTKIKGISGTAAYTAYIVYLKAVWGAGRGGKGRRVMFKSQPARNSGEKENTCHRVCTSSIAPKRLKPKIQNSPLMKATRSAWNPELLLCLKHKFTVDRDASACIVMHAPGFAYYQAIFCFHETSTYTSTTTWYPIVSTPNKKLGEKKSGG